MKTESRFSPGSSLYQRWQSVKLKINDTFLFQVWNYLPSISAAIGGHLPQYIVWCTTITLHMPARFLFIFLYYRYNSKLPQRQIQYLAKVVAVLNIIENLSLLGLTYVTSSAVYGNTF